MRLTFVDFETATGERASPCSIGIVVLQGTEVVERKSWLIRPPGNRYAGFNIAIHGITPEMTRDAPEFGQVWQAVRGYFEDCVAVAHNAAFDMSVLRASLERCGERYPALQYYCTLVLGRAIEEKPTSCRLDSLCGKYGIQFAHHDAEADAWAASQLYARYLALQQCRDMEELARVQGIEPGTLFHKGYTPCRKSHRRRKA